MQPIFGFSSYNTGTEYKKASEYIIWTQDKNMNVFTSASPSGLTFLFLNSYLVKLGLFIYLPIFIRGGYFSVQPSKETFLTFRNVLPINTYAQFYLETGPSSACSHTLQLQLDAWGWGGDAWKSNKIFQSWRLQFPLPHTPNSKASRLQLEQQLSWQF